MKTSALSQSWLINYLNTQVPNARAVDAPGDEVDSRGGTIRDMPHGFLAKWDYVLKQLPDAFFEQSLASMYADNLARQMNEEGADTLEFAVWPEIRYNESGTAALVHSRLSMYKLGTTPTDVVPD